MDTDEFIQKEMVKELRTQWKQLWQDRIDDKVRAEGIAVTNYPNLFIDKGTVIYATRDFATFSFTKILEKNQIENPEKFMPPNPVIGGWTKFVKSNIPNRKQKPEKKEKARVPPEKEKKQLKKGGRGWLHK